MPVVAMMVAMSAATEVQAEPRTVRIGATIVAVATVIVAVVAPDAAAVPWPRCQ